VSDAGHRILRWEIGIDDEDHEVRADGPVLHVAGHRDWTGRVEFWTLAEDDPEFWNAQIGTVAPAQWPPRVFRVFGTGQPIPAGYVHRGTTARTADGLVWHLMELVLARGGPVSRGGPCIVGELGPERIEGPGFLGSGR
jgi:hypothetical protein